MKVDISDDVIFYEVEFSTNIRTFLISLVNLVDSDGESLGFCVYVDRIVDRTIVRVAKYEFYDYEDAFSRFYELENEIIEKGSI